MLAPEEDVEGQGETGFDLNENDSDDYFDKQVHFLLSLEENMYGAVVYVWARNTTAKGFTKYSQRIVITGLFLFTLYIQTIFGWWMIPHVSVNELKEKVDAVNQFAAWRAEANNHTAQFICTGREWSWRENVADEMIKYNEQAYLLFAIPVTRGVMFGVLSMCLWVCLLIIQLRAASASLALFGLDDTTIRDHVQSVSAQHKHAHHQMSWNMWNEAGDGCCVDPHRTSNAKIVIVGTFLVRLAATLGFGFFGMKFLAYTDNLRDFILNCVALAFVFEIPDLVYRAFALVDTQEEIRDLNAAFAKAKLTVGVYHYAAVGQFVLLIGIAIGLFVYGVSLLNAFNSMQENQVFRELCATVPGNTSDIF